jgi:hypothetical protein
VLTKSAEEPILDAHFHTQPVTMQIAFQFLVPVLALATPRVIVV